MTNKRYYVYEDKMMLAQVGERYEETRESESELVPEKFDNLSDASDRLDEIVGGWGRGYEIIHTKRGLDTVVYSVAWIDEEEGDDYYDDPVLVRRVESLPKVVRKAAMNHQHDYWAYLDYESEYYSPLAIEHIVKKYER